jgi:hypothetical protein
MAGGASSNSDACSTVQGERSTKITPALTSQSVAGLKEPHARHAWWHPPARQCLSWSGATVDEAAEAVAQELDETSQKAVFSSFPDIRSYCRTSQKSAPGLFLLLDTPDEINL